MSDQPIRNWRADPAFFIDGTGFVIDDGSKGVATDPVMVCDEVRTIEEAYLIAAAPDLYAACEALSNARDLLGFMAAQMHAREAMKKARGEAVSDV